MIRAAYVLVLLMLAMNAPQAGVFRCETANGVVFTDQPCNGEGERIEIPDNRIGGQLDRNLPPPQVEPPTEQVDKEVSTEAPSTCRFINSTDLRRHIVREEVVRGMTRENVRRAFGSPPETYSSPQEVWIYQTRYYGALYELTYVYFRDGCVQRVEYRKP
ncbi:DUF4124 domain-containing protein [Marinobacter sp. F4206]|uniref:DUF4124 domain-containing protein n=1 Tax=Marinobacter sp. F4206 TaxID=2861777 RepID=UPI001C5D1764|nr:DUF4124 domain-containing protein [Marinobacter sp. F4206]MBW4934748.1 DUF4124 domain-containing protein [Marinobacter sp. F4206]